MIEAKNISKTFSSATRAGSVDLHAAVAHVSLKIEDGSFVALLGPSGCGKSTFLEILAGLQAPTTGEVYIDGTLVLEPLPTDKKELKVYRKKHRFLSPIANDLIRDNPKFDTAMVFQDHAVFPWMTTLNNVIFALKLRGIPKEDLLRLAMENLYQVGLSKSAHKYPSQLSGGMRQRLALARALAVNPKIILMDEPFGSVDAITREKLQDDLLQIWTGTNKTIIFVTHDIEEALYLADQIVVFTPLPGSIRKIVTVDIPRPRLRTDVIIAQKRQEIMEIYKGYPEEDSDEV